MAVLERRQLCVTIQMDGQTFILQSTLLDFQASTQYYRACVLCLQKRLLIKQIRHSNEFVLCVQLSKWIRFHSRRTFDIFSKIATAALCTMLRHRRLQITYIQTKDDRSLFI